LAAISGLDCEVRGLRKANNASRLLSFAANIASGDRTLLHDQRFRTAQGRLAVAELHEAARAANRLLCVKGNSHGL
jgi:hypothetical protein